MDHAGSGYVHTKYSYGLRHYIQQRVLLRSKQRLIHDLAVHQIADKASTSSKIHFFEDKTSRSPSFTKAIYELEIVLQRSSNNPMSSHIVDYDSVSVGG